MCCIIKQTEKTHGGAHEENIQKITKKQLITKEQKQMSQS